MKLSVDEIAMIAHEVNRAYCSAIGDKTQSQWAECPEWQKQSAIFGVQFAIENLNATPEDMHDSWMKQKIADGWRYGETKNPAEKTHPCMLPYSELPLEQRTKDYLFKAVVSSALTLQE